MLIASKFFFALKKSVGGGRFRRPCIPLVFFCRYYFARKKTYI